MSLIKKKLKPYKTTRRLLDVCPYCKGFVDIHIDDKNKEAWLEDAYKRKMKMTKQSRSNQE